MLLPFEIMEKAWMLFRKRWSKLIVLPLIMFVVNMIPVLAFPWTLTSSVPPTSNNEALAAIVVQILILLIYILLMCAYLWQCSQMLSGKSPSKKKAIDSAKKRYWPFITASVLTVAIVFLGSILYLVLYSFLVAQAATTGQPLLFWPLVLGLPLLAPGVYIAVRYMAAVLYTAIDGKAALESFHLSAKLVSGRWWVVLVNLFVPAFLWSILNFLIALAILIPAFMVLAGITEALALPSQYLSIIVNGIIYAMVFTPLTTLSVIVLFQQLKKRRK